MKACKLEKRTDAVIRWLERMKIAYSSGAVESAYMDAECARADLEDLRSDVFAVMKPSGHSGILAAFREVAQVILLSAVIVTVMVTPLSRENFPAVKSELVIQAVPVQAETIPEPAVSTVKTEALTPPVKPSKPRKASVQKRTAAQPQTAMKPAPKPEPKTEPKPAKTVAHDKIYSLIQTGQRALKNDKSVIKVK